MNSINHRIAIEVLTEWDKQNVFAFFEKHFPNCNDARWDISEVLIGDIWFLNNFGYLFGYEATEIDRQNRIIANYTILEGVPKDMELPKVEPNILNPSILEAELGGILNKMVSEKTTTTREQELEELVNKIAKWGKKYPKGLTWKNHIATKIENEIYGIAEQAKQLLNQK